jgi:alpha-acetolactate decarboxylase
MRRGLLGTAALVAGLAACSAPGWDGRVERWGTLRAVMRDGDKGGRVVVEDVVRPSSVGLGALAGLEGELLVLDGFAWAGRSASSGTSVERVTGEDEAALLFLAEVPRWRTATLIIATQAETFSPHAYGAVYGARAPSTIPVVFHGKLTDVEAHVLAGRCPYASGDTSGEDPVVRTFAKANGTLVGFWTQEPPGELTHHGSSLHWHVLLDEPERFVGHLDRGRLLAGGSVSVPE